MKALLYIFLIVLELYSCSTKPVKETLVITDLIDSSIIRRNYKINIIKKDTLNYTDSNGLKQGIWKTFINGKLSKVETYRDGKLNGKCIEFWNNKMADETNYSNGIRNGYSQSWGYGDTTNASFIIYWEKGEKIWAAFPYELDGLEEPVKGFLTEKDTVEIRVPYNSGRIKYKGKIIGKGGNRGEGIGIHRAFYETGEVKSILDFDKETIIVFDKRGNIIKTKKFLK